MSTDAVDRSPEEFLQLVADPQRWQLLRELARSDRRVGELTEVLGRPQNLVSYHLAELREAGLVSSRRSSADRRDIYYRVDLLRCRDLLGAAGAALHPGVRLTPAPPAALAAHGGRTPLVLFLCTGNSSRSQMAEALLEHRSGHAIGARSAGSHPTELHPNAVRIMAERGIDISGRRSKHLRRFTRNRFDRVITLCDKVKEICPEFPGTPAAAHWSMPDPAAEADGPDACGRAFCRTADELEVRIALLIGELTAQSSERRHHVH